MESSQSKRVPTTGSPLDDEFEDDEDEDVSEDRQAQKEWAVYVFWREGECLYVGISGRPFQKRTGEHRNSPWWREMTTLRKHPVFSEHAARNLEARFIAHHRPTYNIQHNTNRSTFYCQQCGDLRPTTSPEHDCPVLIRDELNKELSKAYVVHTKLKEDIAELSAKLRASDPDNPSLSEDPF